MSPPSSNWLALKKNLTSSGAQELCFGQGRRVSNAPPYKRQKVDTASEGAPERSTIAPPPKPGTTTPEYHFPANRDSVESLRQMVRGQVEYSPTYTLPGRYLAIDCEMVGIAGDPKDPSGSRRKDKDESSLARVSVVNYHGAVQLDVFVQQRERVTDWRTPFSGIRESDMVHAKPFSEVQKLVSDLLKDRILVGHAVHNDLKVLLLSHPFNMTRDTQILAGSHGTLNTSKTRLAASTSSNTAPVRLTGKRKPALRRLVSQELGINIQIGEHSSIVDARATMAIYRLHRKTWDRGFLAAVSARERKRSQGKAGAVAAVETTPPGQRLPLNRKRPRADQTAGFDDETDGIPRLHETANKSPRNRKGLSSGLSVVVKKYQGRAATKHVAAGTRGDGVGGSQWWGTLG